MKYFEREEGGEEAFDCKLDEKAEEMDKSINKLFNTKAYYNKWLLELTKDEKSLIYEIVDEATTSAVEEERELIKLLDEYIKLLESEVSRVGGLSIVKPYLQANPTKVAKGEELRTKIKATRGE